MIDDCKNQRLKEHQGSNYFYGDVVVLIPEGGIAPDHGVYGSDPISFITQDRPSSQAMVDRYGRSQYRNGFDGYESHHVDPRDPLDPETLQGCSLWHVGHHEDPSPIMEFPVKHIGVMDIMAL